MKQRIDKKIVLLVARIAMGWVFLYAGYSKIIDPSWSAKAYIAGAKAFPQFYQLLLRPDILPRINILNEWGLFLIGIALVLGAFVRFASFFGFALMILYYLAIFPPSQGYIVDTHIIYALVFLIFMVVPVGEIAGLDALFKKTEIARNHAWFRALLG